jgi:DNA phosphorothioation-dependent restriction protein DptG
MGRFGKLFGKKEEVVETEGAKYGGVAKFKPMRVEIKVSDVNMEQAKYWVTELTNQYADLVIENAKVSSDKITFDVGSPSMSDLTAQDIKFRINEYLTMNIAPFTVREVRVE